MLVKWGNIFIKHTGLYSQNENEDLSNVSIQYEAWYIHIYTVKGICIHISL